MVLVTRIKLPFEVYRILW